MSDVKDTNLTGLFKSDAREEFKKAVIEAAYELQVHGDEETLNALADENATLRVQLAEAERRGREEMRQSFLDVLRDWSSEDGGVFTESRAPSLYERLMSLTKEPTAPPPSDEDVRAALVRTIRAADAKDDERVYATADDVADAILADPLLGKLLRGGR